MTEPKWELTLSVTDRNNIGLIQPRKNNTNSELMRVHVTNKNGEPYDLTALKVFFVTHFSGKDGLKVPIQKEATIINAKEGIFEFTLDEDCMQKVGRQEAYFEIYDYDKFLDATQNFTYEIISSSRDMKADFSASWATLTELENNLGDNAAVNLQRQIDNHEIKKVDIRDLDNRLEGKTDNLLFVAMTEDLQRQIESTQQGMIGTYDSEAQLKATHQNGAKGFAVVYVEEIVNGEKIKVPYTYTYKNNQWVKGQPWNGIGISDEIITPVKQSKLLDITQLKGSFLNKNTYINKNNEIGESYLVKQSSNDYSLALFSNKFYGFQFKIEKANAVQLVLGIINNKTSYYTFNLQLQGKTAGDFYLYDSKNNTLSNDKQNNLNLKEFEKNDIVTVIQTSKYLFSVYKNGDFWITVDTSLVRPDITYRMSCHFGVFDADKQYSGVITTRNYLFTEKSKQNNFKYDGYVSFDLRNEDINNNKAKILDNDLYVETTDKNYNTIIFDSLFGFTQFTYRNSNLYFIIAENSNGYYTVQLSGTGAGSICYFRESDGIFYQLQVNNIESFKDNDDCIIERVTFNTIVIKKNKMNWLTINIEDFSDETFDFLLHGFIVNKNSSGIIATNVVISPKNYKKMMNLETIKDIKPSNARYEGSKIGFLGDSITKANNINAPFHRTIKDYLLLDESINYGVSATRITKPDINGESMCTRYSKMSDDLDAVFVLAGTNDYGVEEGVVIGEFDSTDNTTFYGALHELIKGLVKKYTGKPILIATPLKRSDKIGKNAKGFNLDDYTSAIKEVANYYSIPVLDLNNNYGINPIISDEIKNEWTRDGDGLHPSQKGHDLLASKISIGFLNI